MCSGLVFSTVYVCVLVVHTCVHVHVEAQGQVLFVGGIYLLEAKSLTVLSVCSVRINCLAPESSCLHHPSAEIISSCNWVLLLSLSILGIELGSLYLHTNTFPTEPSSQPIFYTI